MKLFGRGNAKGKPAPITRAGRIIDETQRESAKKEPADEVAAKRAEKKAQS